MLQDLDSTLKALLNRELATELVQQIDFSFDTPSQESIGNKKTVINLFLYDVRENVDLRNGVRAWDQRSEGKAKKMHAPVRVDCSYLITVWTTQAQGERESATYQEHRLLGQIMQVLLRYPKLPLEILQGSLSGQILSLPTTSLRSSQLQNLGEFWQAMGGKPKAALNCTVTIAVPIDQGLEEVPLVSESRIQLEHSSFQE